MKLDKLDLSSIPVPAIADATSRVFGVVMLIAVLILASRWLTELTAPRPVARLAEAAQVQPDSGAAGSMGRMFGVSEAQPQAIEGLRLTGLFANSRGGGFATFHTPKGDVSVLPGGEVAPGIKLKQIEKDRVILLTADAKQELRLSDERGPAVAAAPAASTPVQAGAMAPAQDVTGTGTSRGRSARQSSQEKNDE